MMAWGVMPGTSSGMCEGMSDLLTRGQHLSGDKYGKQSVNPPISFLFENIINTVFALSFPDIRWQIIFLKLVQL